MANAVISLIARLTGDSKNLVDELNKGGAAAARVSREIAQEFHDLSKKTAMISAGIGTALAGGLVYAAKGAMDAKNELAGAFALVDKDSAASMPAFREQLTEASRQIRKDYGLTSETVAEAMRVAIGSGVKLGEVQQFLGTSSKAAVSGMVPLSDVVKVTAGVVKGFGMEMTEAGRVQDALAKAVNLGTVEWSHFAAGLGQVIPFAKMAGLTVEETAGIVATLTLKGIPAMQAMDGLRAALANFQMMKPDSDAAKVFQQLGISVRDANTGAMKPFLAILREVKSKLAEKGIMNLLDMKALKSAQKELDTAKKNVESLRKQIQAESNDKAKMGLQKKLESANLKLEEAKKKVQSVQSTISQKLDKDGTVAALFGDINAKAVAVALMSDNMTELDAVLNQMKNSQGAVNEQFQNFTADNPKFQVQQFLQSFQILRENVGNAVITVFGPLAQILSGIVKGVAAWAGEHPKLTATIVVLTGAIATLAFVISGLATVATLASGAYLALTGSTIAASVAVGGGTLAFGSLAAAVWAALAPILLVIGIAAAVVAAIALIGYAVYSIYKNWETIKDFFGWVWGIIVQYNVAGFEAIISTATAAWEIVQAGVSGFFSWAWGFIKAGWDFVASLFQAAFDWISGIASAGWESVKSASSSVMDAISSVVMTCVNGIKGYWDWLWANLVSGWNAAKAAPAAFANWLMTQMKAACDYVSGLLGQLWTKIKSVPGAIWGKIKAAPGAIWDKVTGNDTVPGYASGGIVTRPTLATIGERGPEAIIPLMNGSVPVRFSSGDRNEPGSAPGFGFGAPVQMYVTQLPGESGSSLASRVGNLIMRRRGLA
jgi:TP901 family phage tail tape measure protein